MNKKILIITIIVFILDQLSKGIISVYLNLNQSINILGDFFSLTYVNNTGAAWSIFSKHTYMITLIGMASVLLIIKYMNSFKKNNRNELAFGLLLGGIAGNLLDRLFFGYVRDFFDFKIFSYNYPIFNISDIAIVIGVMLLIVAILKGEDYGSKSRDK